MYTNDKWKRIKKDDVDDDDENNDLFNTNNVKIDVDDILKNNKVINLNDYDEDDLDRVLKRRSNAANQKDTTRRKSNEDSNDYRSAAGTGGGRWIDSIYLIEFLILIFFIFKGKKKEKEDEDDVDETQVRVRKPTEKELFKKSKL